VIARIWIGKVDISKRDEYFEYLKQTGILDYKNTTGNCGVDVLICNKDDETEFKLISYWESMEIIKNFAGEDIEKARYYPEDKRYLKKLVMKVEHYELYRY
jgi:heme-degrading monooxygenase HmoA